MMIHLLEKLSRSFLDLSEINQNTAAIQFSSSEHHLYFPIMTMQVFTLAAKVPEVMGCREIAHNLNFVKPARQSNPPPLVNDLKSFEKSNYPRP